MALKFSRLTRPAIRSLQTGDKINEHGIIAERTTTGDVRYSVNIMVDGQRVHRVVGRESEGVTREQADARSRACAPGRARVGLIYPPPAKRI